MRAQQVGQLLGLRRAGAGGHQHRVVLELGQQTETELGIGRHLRHVTRACGAGDGEHAQLAGGHPRQIVAEQHRHRRQLARHQVFGRRAGTTVGDMAQVDLRQPPQRRADQVRAGAHARRTEAGAIRMELDPAQVVAQRADLGRHRRTDDKADRRAADGDDRLEVLLPQGLASGDLRHQGDRGGRRGQQHRAVARCGGHLPGRGQTGCPRTAVELDGLGIRALQAGCDALQHRLDRPPGGEAVDQLQITEHAGRRLGPGRGRSRSDSEGAHGTEK